MPKYHIAVEWVEYHSGTMCVEAESSGEAAELAYEQCINWDTDPPYELTDARSSAHSYDSWAMAETYCLDEVDEDE